MPGHSETIVYNIGTLYGEWPDSTPFQGNRYVDRFVVRGGKNSQLDFGTDFTQEISLPAPKGTILLLTSCPMSARPNQGIPDLRHQ